MALAMVGSPMLGCQHYTGWQRAGIQEPTPTNNHGIGKTDDGQKGFARDKNRNF
jgi:hypothetical protein